MNSRALAVLTACAVLIILGAWWLSTARAPSSPQTAAKLYPELKGKLDAIQGLRIFGPGNQLNVEIVRTGEGFSVQQRAGYKAETAKINNLLTNLADAKLSEEKTSNPANYATLGVQAPQEEKAKSARLEITGTPINLIVGRTDPASRATYVRRNDEATSWLVDVELNIPTEPKQWLQRNLLDVAANRVFDARIELAGVKPYSLKKTDIRATNFDVEGIPKGREVESVAEANAIAQALVDLRLDDVRPASELANAKSVGRVAVRTFDGLVVEIDGYGSDEMPWVIFKASDDDAIAKRFHQPDPSAPKDQPDASLAAITQKNTDESAAINKRVSGWAYAIPAQKYDALFKPLEQLLKH
ncbi:MAG: DUF4340 domain-containing protein [Candidatus Obscuribacterales bacterium]|nr:DUF4340 domain-containing protein [Steroidobacteraceae bacterium]